MRILTVQPGPDWSVMDVHRGWQSAFEQLGHQVKDFATNDRLAFYEDVRLEDDSGHRQAFPDIRERAVLASKDLESALYEWWPDLLWVTYGPALDPNTLRLARARGHIVVLCHTESPYEDDRQISWAAGGVADLHLINDPTNLDRWREAEPHTYYLPHSYDPAVHRMPPSRQHHKHDVVFVGSSFPSRIEWFSSFTEAAPDLDLLLAGNWKTCSGQDHPLQRHCPHDFADCLDNREVPPLYWQSRVGLNIYRRESERPELSGGWSMGPREVEMAACGLFFLTEERGENRQVLPMVPTFDGPEDAAERARWWVAHPDRRNNVALAARAAVKDWTFQNRARQVLDLIARLNAA